MGPSSGPIHCLSRPWFVTNCLLHSRPSPFASTDSTKAIAEAAGVNFVYRPWEGYAKTKNWGIEQLPRLSEGAEFELREGARVVGHGVLLADDTAR